MTTYVFKRNNEYLIDFDVAGIPVTTSNDLIIQGYGRYSGRKFWQLPDALQKEILQRIN